MFAHIASHIRRNQCTPLAQLDPAAVALALDQLAREH
jgi:hypothetical protein